MNYKTLIEKDIKSKKGRYDGRKYYDYKREKQPDVFKFDVVDENGQPRTIEINNNNAIIYTNYFKLLVKQKINYLMAKQPTFTENQYIRNIDIIELLKRELLDTALDSRGWIHFFINDENKLDWVHVHDSEIIPIYDKWNKNIIEIIRYYKINEDKNGNFNVEHWTKTGVTYITLNEFEIVDKIEETHYKTDVFFNGELQTSLKRNFTFLPFIQMINNTDKQSDIEPIHELIDYYNQISSGFIDNINKFQEAIIKLKGFSGDENTLQETLKNLRKYKMAGLPSDGDMDYMAIDIPVEARKLLLEILEHNIFKLGQGYNADQLGDGNITNVVIINRYSGLDSKANDVEPQLKLFYADFIDKISMYHGVSLNNEIEFNRSMLVNETEKIDNCVKSVNIAATETILKNHPWVVDVNKEMEKLKQEKTDMIDEFNSQMSKNKNFNNNNTQDTQ